MNTLPLYLCYEIHSHVRLGFAKTLKLFLEAVVVSAQVQYPSYTHIKFYFELNLNIIQ